MAVYGLRDLGSDTRRTDTQHPERRRSREDLLKITRTVSGIRDVLIVLPLARFVNLAAVTTGGLIVKKI